MKNFLVCLVFGGLWSAMVLADEAGVSRADAGSGRAQKRMGAYVGIGNPFPSILGLNAAYNINENIRATAGYGEVEVTTSVSFSQSGYETQKVTAKTYGVGVDYLFMTTQVRPLVGVHGGYFDMKGKGKFSIQGFDRSTALAYSNLGLDWLTNGGFNMGTGLNVALLGGSGVNFYANIGYFF